MKSTVVFGLLASVLAEVQIDDLKRDRTKKPR
jgi:hypothetical protein